MLRIITEQRGNAYRLELHGTVTGEGIGVSNGTGSQFWTRRHLRSSSSACQTWGSSIRTASSYCGEWRSVAWNSMWPVA